MSTLLVERSLDPPGLMTVTLNRPERLNAINIEVHSDLQALCRDLQTDHQTRVVIFTGAGRAFSAGADIGGSRTPAGSAATSTMRAQQEAESALQERVMAGTGSRTAELLESLDQVTIGAVNGLAVGGAVVLLSCMDIRFAAESAWFAIPEVDLDIPLTWNALPRQALSRRLRRGRSLTCSEYSWPRWSPDPQKRLTRRLGSPLGACRGILWDRGYRLTQHTLWLTHLPVARLPRRWQRGRRAFRGRCRWPLALESGSGQVWQVAQTVLRPGNCAEPN